MKHDTHDRRKHHHQCLSVLLLIYMILLHATCPASLSAMDLVEAYIMAKDHDPVFGSSFYEHEAAKTFSRQGLAYLLPQIQASGSTSNYTFDSNAPAYYLNYTSQFMGISLKQPVFNLPRFYDYQQHKIRESIGDARFTSAEQDLILRLAEAYFNVLTAGNVLELIDTEKEAVTEQIEQAKRMFQAGVGTITDVHDAEARHDAVLSQEVEAKNDLDIKMQALKKIIGTEPVGLNILKEDIPLSMPEPATLDGWVEKAKQYNPALKSSARQIDYQQRELQKNKGQYWPSVDMVAGYSSTNTNNLIQTQNTNYSSVGVQVNIPLFDGGYTTAKVAESRATLGQANKEYDKALADTVQKLGEAFLGIQGSIAKIGALLTAVRSASTSLHSNKMGLLAGVKTTVDVLNAQRELHDVSRKLVQARYDYLLNVVRLKSSAGTLSGDDVLTINQWLQARQAR